MSLAQSVIEIIESRAAATRFERVTVVRLEIGALSCIEPSALDFCFETVARGTRADGAVLEIIPLPGAAWCAGCAQPVTIARRGDPCPRCGAYHLQVQAGTEMRLKELEVE